MLWPGIGRVKSFSNTAAVGAPSILICPRCISVFEVHGFVITVKFERGGPLFLGPEARILGSAEGKLIFHSRARQVHGQQSGLGAIDVLEGACEVRSLYGRGEAERNIVG